jgi:malate permease and related proteins
LDALFFSFNAIFPIFLVMALGYFLKYIGIISEAFISIGTKITFSVAIPCMVFSNIVGASIKETFDLGLALFAVIATSGSFILLRLIVPHFIKESPQWSAYIQGAFRSNYLILGFALLNALGGTPALTKGAMLFVFMGPLYNVLSVLVLAEAQKGSSGHNVLRSIYTNPVIISTALAIILALLGVKLPLAISSPIDMLGDMALPLSLLTLGATISFQHGYTKISQAISASLIKVFFIPLVLIPVSCLLGFRVTDIIVCLVLFASPSAVSCFPMAYQMGADHRLTGMIVALTSTFAILTLFLFVYALRATAMI